MPVLYIPWLATLGKLCSLDGVLASLPAKSIAGGLLCRCFPATRPKPTSNVITNLGGFFTLGLLNILRFRPTRLAIVFLLLAISAFAQDPFFSLGTAAT